jgi:hypothetical protein
VDQPLAAAGGLVGLYRASSAYGAYAPPNDMVIQTSSGIQYTIPFPTSFSNAQTTTWVVTNPSASVGVGAVYADANGTQHTVTSGVVAGTFTTTSVSTTAPYGMGSYPYVGGTLTKVSGAGDSSVAYTTLANTDFYTLSTAVAVVSGYTGNVSQGAVTQIVSTLADSAVVIKDSQAMTGGAGLVTTWSLLS